MCIYSYLGSHIGHKGKISTGYHIGYNIEGWLKIPSVHGTDRQISTQMLLSISQRWKKTNTKIYLYLSRYVLIFPFIVDGWLNRNGYP